MGKTEYEQYERECLALFKQLSMIDKGRILSRMEYLISNYYTKKANIIFVSTAPIAEGDK